MSDYGDACATVRTAIRDALAKTSHITGLRHGDKAEAIVEAIIAEIHDPTIAWAFQAILARKI